MRRDGTAARLRVPGPCARGLRPQRALLRGQEPGALLRVREDLGRVPAGRDARRRGGLLRAGGGRGKMRGHGAAWLWDDHNAAQAGAHEGGFAEGNRRRGLRRRLQGCLRARLHGGGRRGQEVAALPRARRRGPRALRPGLLRGPAGGHAGVPLLRAGGARVRDHTLLGGGTGSAAGT